MSVSVAVGRDDALEEAVGRLELHWKSCRARGDKRGEDMAEGINLAIESIRSLRSVKEPELKGLALIEAIRRECPTDTDVED